MIALKVNTQRNVRPWRTSESVRERSLFVSLNLQLVITVYNFPGSDRPKLKVIIMNSSPLPKLIFDLTDKGAFTNLGIEFKFFQIDLKVFAWRWGVNVLRCHRRKSSFPCRVQPGWLYLVDSTTVVASPSATPLRWIIDSSVDGAVSIITAS